MKTVSTLIGTSTAIATSVVGTIVARPQSPAQSHSQSRPLHQPHRGQDLPPLSDSHLRPASRLVFARPGSASAPSDMTSTSTCTVVAAPASISSPFNFSARQSLRSITSAPRPTRDVRTETDDTLKRRVELYEDLVMDPALESNESTTGSQWLKRLSTFSTSSSSRQSSPHPDGSIACSYAGSTAPIVASQAATIVRPPNKLVKRSTSLRASPTETFGSRIPKPTLSRPATSHERSVTLQERRTRQIRTAHGAFSDSGNAFAADIQWQTFFAPKVLVEPSLFPRRRNSTSIPNPIKRIYSDRRYRPTLVSAGEPVSRSTLQFEIDSAEPASVYELEPPARSLSTSLQGNIPPGRLASDPLRQTPNFNQDMTISQGPNHADRAPRRSFSIGDWFPGETHTWRRPLSRASMGKYRRRGRASPSASSNTTDAPSTSNDEQEPPAKRRGLTRATLPHRESYVSASQRSERSSFTVDRLVPAPADTSMQNGPFFSGHQDSERHDEQPPTLDPPLAMPSFSRQTTPETELLPELGSAPAGLDSRTLADLKSVRHRESIFDSDHTMIVRSNPGRRGPAIETIFQESPPVQVHGRHTLLRDILQPGSFQDHGRGLRPRHSIIHEEEFLATPPRSSRHQDVDPSPKSKFSASTPDMIPSSPPEMPSLLRLRHRDHFSDADDDQESSWSIEDDGEDNNGQRDSHPGRFAHLGIASDLLTSSTASTPQHTSSRQVDKDAKSNIFDWSEQQPFDRTIGDHSPPRPKTVHGKKDAENRGSRSVGRRAPSGVHARSQSVPVVQEADGKRVQVVTNKFGTWGVGSKGVTEDWNEDFDFGDAQAVVPIIGPGEEKRLDSGIGMLVPKAIREQQTNVLANIGLLRDWGLLIEEIKELKMRALALDLYQGNDEPTWKEVDAMIDLADQESNEHTLAPRYSPPSSPSFNYDDFEEPVNPIITNRQQSRPSPSQGIRKVEALSASPPRLDHEIQVTPATPRRPRKDSEAVARSVIESLQQKRVASDPGPAFGGHTEKVHFDTATLRRIIPYVQDLRDRVKGILREAEGLYASPPHKRFSDDDPSFSRMFRERPDSPSMRRTTRRSTNIAENFSSDDEYPSSNEELAARLRFMTVV